MSIESPALVIQRDGARWPGTPPSLSEAQAYCRGLAREHYENFTVASRLAPPRLRQHLANIYAYCRWADDLADETGDPDRSLILLDDWEWQLASCYRGQARHPVFVALADTIRCFDLPREPLGDLLVAFRRDQRQNRYATFEELLDYCCYSANPVGRLVLHLGRACDEANASLSDSICTGLQLVNLWQDVRRDFLRGRVYLPHESLRRFGCDESMLSQPRTPEVLRQLIAFEVERAETYLRTGWPLIRQVPKELRLPIDLFIRGGLATAQRIRRTDFDVLAQRPTLSRWDKLRLVAQSWWGSRHARAGGAP